jgi:hypothetical protein
MSSRSSSPQAILDGLKQGVVWGAAALAVLLPPVGGARTALTSPSVQAAAATAPRLPRYADFGAEVPSAAARHVADWVADSGDNQRMSFVIVDKRDARVYLFEPDGRLKAATPVLLGAAAGDHSVVGIGQRPIAEVRPEERTTPAGRFLAEPGRNAQGEDIVWIDYDAAVSMHRLRALEPKERRHERLASPSPEDNRISYGCINVPPSFYDAHVKPTFDRRRGVVYVLPETLPLDQVFADSYDVKSRYRHAQLTARRDG